MKRAKPPRVLPSSDSEASLGDDVRRRSVYAQKAVRTVKHARTPTQSASIADALGIEVSAEVGAPIFALREDVPEWTPAALIVATTAYYRATGKQPPPNWWSKGLSNMAEKWLGRLPHLRTYDGVDLRTPFFPPRHAPPQFAAAVRTEVEDALA